MAFRMGVNLGDVIAGDGTIHGDGVNIAATAGEARGAGSVCIGRNVYDQVRGKLAYGYADLGEQPVHNIPEPVHAYRVKPSRAGTDRRRLARDCAKAGAAATRQAVDRGPAVPEHERRPRAGVFRRRHGGRDHHGAVAHALAVRDRPQFELHLQGPGRGREAGRARARGTLRARRQRAQGGQPGAHHRPAHRHCDGRPSLGGPLRRARSRTSSICRIR